MKTLLLHLAAVGLLHASEGAKPNILLIYADDLGETKNLAATMPEKVAEKKVLLDKLITGGRSTPGVVQKNDVDVKRYPSVSTENPKKKENPPKINEP